jgi:serine/threonine protein kinase
MRIAGFKFVRYLQKGDCLHTGLFEDSNNQHIVIKQCVSPKYRKLIVNEIVALKYAKKYVPRDLHHHFVFPIHFKINDFFDSTHWFELPYITYNYIPQDKSINAVCVTRQLIQIVKTIHSIGLKHNDIKPQNLIVCNKVVKLIDFGLSTIKKQTIKY